MTAKELEILIATGEGLLTRIPQLDARTETEKTGFLTNKKVQAVAGTTNKLFCDGKKPGFSVESRDPTGEFGLTEFKEKYTPKIDRDLVAFANAKGGKILLGVSDDGKIVGEKLTGRLKAEIQDVARHCEPPLTLKSIRQVGSVVVVEVPEGEDPPYSCAGAYFRRLDAVSQKMNRKELSAHFANAQGSAFEDRLDTSFTTKDLSPAKVQRFLRETQASRLNVPPSAVVASLSLVEKEGLRNAGVLLFAEDPQKAFPHCEASFVHFRGTARVHLLDRLDVRNDLFTQLDEAVFFLQKHLNTRSEIRGVQRDDILEIPLAALREAVVNALVHRDYSFRGTSLLVEIHDDRVEIVNPGGLPEGMTVASLSGVSIRRNPKIADAFARARRMERLGTGFSRMRDLLSAQGLPPPRFESGPFFRAIFQRPDVSLKSEGVSEGVNEGVNEGMNALLKIVQGRPGLRVPQLSKTVGVPTKTLERWLRELKSRNAIFYKGSSRKGGYWITDEKKEK